MHFGNVKGAIITQSLNLKLITLIFYLATLGVIFWKTTSKKVASAVLNLQLINFPCVITAEHESRNKSC